MRVGISIGGLDAGTAEFVVEAERLGADAVWAAEFWPGDALTPRPGRSGRPYDRRDPAAQAGATEWGTRPGRGGGGQRGPHRANGRPARRQPSRGSQP